MTLKLKKCETLGYQNTNKQKRIVSLLLLTFVKSLTMCIYLKVKYNFEILVNYFLRSILNLN